VQKITVAQPRTFTTVAVSSPQFKSLLDFLILLKSPKTDAVLEIDKDVQQVLKLANIRMCTTCWYLICEQEIPQHKGEGHNMTTTFSAMAQADKASVLGLFKSHKHLIQANNKKESESKVQMLTFSDMLTTDLSKFSKFKNGRLAFMFKQIPPQQAPIKTPDKQQIKPAPKPVQMKVESSPVSRPAEKKCTKTESADNSMYKCPIKGCDF